MAITANSPLPTVYGAVDGKLDVVMVNQLLTPGCLCILLLLIAVIFDQRKRLRRVCLWTGIGILVLGGNDWVGRWAALPLERRLLASHTPSSDTSSRTSSTWVNGAIGEATNSPLPRADAIVILGGGLRSKEWPRATVEVSESGDRVLYAFDLYRQKKAPLILCAGGGSKHWIREFSEAEDMRTLLMSFGVASDAIRVETNSLNTLENAVNSRPIIEANQIRRLLLVTSAVHMPRALAVFRRQFPALEVTPAPTDYMFTDSPKLSARDVLEGCIPTGEHLMRMELTLHEYIGLLYYRLRGWI